MLDEHGYPPVERDEVYEEIFEQAENYKSTRYKNAGAVTIKPAALLLKSFLRQPHLPILHILVKQAQYQKP